MRVGRAAPIDQLYSLIVEGKSSRWRTKCYGHEEKHSDDEEAQHPTEHSRAIELTGGREHVHPSDDYAEEDNRKSPEAHPKPLQPPNPPKSIGCREVVSTRRRHAIQ